MCFAWCIPSCQWQCLPSSSSGRGQSCTNTWSASQHHIKCSHELFVRLALHGACSHANGHPCQAAAVRGNRVAPTPDHCCNIIATAVIFCCMLCMLCMAHAMVLTPYIACHHLTCMCVCMCSEAFRGGLDSLAAPFPGKPCHQDSCPPPASGL